MLNETNTAWVEIKQEHFFNLSGYTSFLKWNKWKFNNLFWLCEQNSVIHGKFKSNYSYEMQLLITYTRKNAQPVQGWWKQPWTMLCCPHCSMLSTILFSIVTPDCGLIQAQHWRILFWYCWQHWTMWAAQHCSRLFSSTLNKLCVFCCVINHIIKPKLLHVDLSNIIHSWNILRFLHVS